MRELVLRHEDVASLRTDLDQNLSRGRAFVPGEVALTDREPCVLVVVHPTSKATHRLEAEIVYARAEDPGRGVGLMLVGASPERVEALRLFVGEPEPEPVVEELQPVDAEPELEELGSPEEELVPVEGDDGADDGEEGESTDGVAMARAKTLQDRLRGLSMTEQLRLARTGILAERVLLERIYGPVVWEALLQNGRITLPEVARIAKKGTLPRPLIDVIAANAGWAQAPDVQRALLGNPRTGPMVVTKLLRMLSRADLARVPQQTAYPMTTRQAARKLL